MDDTKEFGKFDESFETAIDELLTRAHSKLEPRLRRIARPRASIGIARSPLGPMLVAESNRGLAALTFLDRQDGNAAVAALREKFDLTEDQRAGNRIANEITEYLHGNADAIAHHAVDFSLVEGGFQRRALARLRQVPAGAVVTYQALAAAIGTPSGQRAIGNAMALNPIPIYVPCHRVIRSDGSIGNYAGGTERKLKLLRTEGFPITDSNRLPSGAVYGHWVSRIFCRPDCSAVKRAERKRWLIFADPERALTMGLRPCKLCHPA